MGDGLKLLACSHEELEEKHGRNTGTEQMDVVCVCASVRVLSYPIVPCCLLLVSVLVPWLVF